MKHLAAKHKSPLLVKEIRSPNGQSFYFYIHIYFYEYIYSLYDTGKHASAKSHNKKVSVYRYVPLSDLCGRNGSNFTAYACDK